MVAPARAIQNKCIIPTSTDIQYDVAGNSVFNLDVIIRCSIIIQIDFQVLKTGEPESIVERLATLTQSNRIVSDCIFIIFLRENISFSNRDFNIPALSQGNLKRQVETIAIRESLDIKIGQMPCFIQSDPGTIFNRCSDIATQNLTTSKTFNQVNDVHVFKRQSCEILTACGSGITCPVFSGQVNPTFQKFFILNNTFNTTDGHRAQHRIAIGIDGIIIIRIIGSLQFSQTLSVLLQHFYIIACNACSGRIAFTDNKVVFIESTGNHFVQGRISVTICGERFCYFVNTITVGIILHFQTVFETIRRPVDRHPLRRRYILAFNPEIS